MSGKDGLDTGVCDWLGEEGDKDSKEADSSNFLFNVGLGASLINVDWRTSPGFSDRSDSLPLDFVDDIRDNSAFFEVPVAPH